MTLAYDIEAYIIACNTLLERANALLRNHAKVLEDWQIDRACAMLGKAKYEALRWRKYADIKGEDA